jgi:hypothetical protein
MPNAAKQFRNFPKRASKRRCTLYRLAAWQKFREHINSIRPAICVDCNAALPSRFMNLDHEPPLTGDDDPGAYDEARVFWRCQSCHSKKTKRQNA